MTTVLCLFSKTQEAHVRQREMWVGCQGEIPRESRKVKKLKRLNSSSLWGAQSQIKQNRGRKELGRVIKFL